MKDEIKEILRILKAKSKRYEYCLNANISYSDESYEANLLLDYITNLQTIEQQYSAILSENAESENKITNLQQEIEKLNNIINGMEKFFKYAYDNEVKPLNDRKISVWTICLDKLQELKGVDKDCTD